MTVSVCPIYDSYKESSVDWLGRVPSTWPLIRLGGLFEERKAKVSDKDFEPLSVTKNGIFPQLESAAKTNDGDNRKLVITGDFVINSRSDRKGSSGISPLDGSVSLINIVLKPKEIQPDFCHYILKSYAFIEEYYRIGHGIVADLWTTRYDEMRSIIMALPLPDEQRAIVAFLDEKCSKIDEAVRIKKEQIALLRERRQILIQQAVTRGLNPATPMKDSGINWIGQIPVHWEVKRFTKEIYVQEGPGIMAVDFRSAGVPLIRISGLRTTSVTLEGCNYLDPLKVRRKWKHFLIEEGDLVVSGSASTGLVAEVSQEAVGAVLYTGLIKLKVKHSKSLSRAYMKTFLSSSLFDTQVELLKAGSTIAHFGPSHLGEMFVVLPPIGEQTKIAAYCSYEKTHSDSVVKIKQEQIAALKEYKISLIHEAVTGKIKVA